MGGFELLGYAGAAVNIVTYSMRTMIPLRIMAIASNCIFIVYGSIGSVYPILVLHAVLLPLNAYRLREMLRLVANVRNAAQNDLQLDWLKPFMAKRRYAKGDVLFRQGVRPARCSSRCPAGSSCASSRWSWASARWSASLACSRRKIAAARRSNASRQARC
jgi:hypothetical protein